MTEKIDLSKEQAERLVDRLLQAPEAMDYAHARQECIEASHV